MRYRITHHTTYQYRSPVSQCYNVARLAPRDTSRQRCLSSHVQVTPTPASSTSRNDYFGNRTRHFAIHEPHSRLQISAFSVVEVERTGNGPRSNLLTGEAQRLIRESTTEEGLLAREYLVNSPLVARAPALADYARQSFPPERPFLDGVNELVNRIFLDFAYDPGFTTVSTPLDEVFARRRGVCQDFAHLAIGCFRSLGIPARYVSGYIETLPPPGEEKLVGADASHAWFSVYAPNTGWCDFDPTNDTAASDQHITVGWGRDYSDVAPLKGVLFGNGEEQQLAVSVDVQRMDGPVDPPAER